LLNLLWLIAKKQSMFNLNTFPLQQTSPTFFLISMIVIFILLIFIIGSKRDKKKINLNNDKLVLLSDEKKEVLEEVIENYQKGIEDICSFVEKHYDKSKSLIAIEPKDYGFYDEIIDPIEKTEVMVIEYLQNLKEKQRNYKFEWSYQGLIDGLCVYKISKTSKYSKKENFSIDDINSALLKNNTINEKPFTDKNLNILISPFLVPIDNLGFNRQLNELETNEVVKDFCKDSEFKFIKDRMENAEKNGIKYHRYFLSYSDNLKKKKKIKSRRISQDVKDKVWNRDGGKCVECGSNENLEFDHIIPHSKGGANTYRNIQLLCEPCNRRKSAKIG
jgi:hypothetical protein